VGGERLVTWYRNRGLGVADVELLSGLGKARRGGRLDAKLRRRGCWRKGTVDRWWTQGVVVVSCRHPNQGRGFEVGRGARRGAHDLTREGKVAER
jgi:hypothetical protein